MKKTEETFRDLHQDVIIAMNAALNLIPEARRPALDDLILRFPERLAIEITLRPTASLTIGLRERGRAGPITPLIRPIPLPEVPEPKEHPDPTVRPPVETEVIAEDTETAVTVHTKPRGRRRKQRLN